MRGSGRGGFRRRPDLAARIRSILAILISAADMDGVRRATLSDLVDGKAGLSPEMALGIEKAFGVSMDTLLRMGAWYDSHAMRRRADEIDVKRYHSV